MQKNQTHKRSIAGILLLPGIFPRLREFSQDGFGWLAQMMAVIYYSVRLIPHGHPYLDPANKGRFGVRHVIAVAAHNLTFKKENIDQIIVFTALLLGFVVLIMQFALVLGVFVIQPAFAGPPLFAGIFATPSSVGVGTSQDIAFMMMDSVFGVPGIFTTAGGAQVSCVAAATLGACGPDFPALPAFPTPFQVALHSLFNYYNLAILIVAVLIFCYYVVIMVAETAQTGTPFGKRFSHIWAPIRLVVALGLLVPISIGGAGGGVYGFNSAQVIVFYAAKLGSGFATNGWHLFNSALDNAIGLDNAVLIAQPNMPNASIGPVMQFMSIVSSCKYAYERTFKDTNSTDPFIQNYNINAYLVREDNLRVDLAGTDYNAALTFFNQGDIIIRFGHYNPQYENEKGNVKPVCGEITVKTVTRYFPGAVEIQEEYYEWIRTQFWPKMSAGPYYEFARRVACVYEIEPKINGNLPAHCNNGTLTPAVGDDNVRDLPPDSWKQAVTTDEVDFLTLQVNNIFNQIRAGTGAPIYAVDVEILNRGWAGAGIWYNQIAEWNGAVVGAVKTLPSPNKMPEIMEFVEKNIRMQNENVRPKDRFDPRLRSGLPIQFTDPKESTIAIALGDVFKYWREYNTTAPLDTRSTNNFLMDIINTIFGTEALFSIRDNQDIHPLAQLSALGKGIVDSAIQNLLVALPFAAGGGFTESLNAHAVSAGLSGIGSIGVTFAGVGLGVGFVLYYILPYLPFIYFFFALSAWVKTIFEAMVGVPLWALAHLRVDGNGLPGETALNGYFLIFEIFLRPILSVFGLLASITVFGAMAQTFNEIFSMVVDNLSGHDCSANPVGCDRRVSAIDQFAFTIIYTLIIYMMATSSFKMIDQIPQSILRWMGGGVDSFGDTAGDPKEGLVQYAAYGGAQFAQRAAGAMQEGARAVGMIGAAPVSLAKNLVGRQTSISGSK